MPRQQCYYDVLGIDRAASQAAVRAAYRALALRHHPDKHPPERRRQGFDHRDCMAAPTAGGGDLGTDKAGTDHDNSVGTRIRIWLDRKHCNTARLPPEASESWIPVVGQMT